MFQVFNNQISNIDTPKTFLRCIKSLRTLNLETPLTEGYEEILRERGQHPMKTWYTNQGEHWQGWVGDYVGIKALLHRFFAPQAYKRKKYKRDAKFIYNHIMCPPMLIWLAENAGIDEKIIKTAINESLKSDSYQTQCKVVRKYISWREVEKAILSKIAG